MTGSYFHFIREDAIKIHGVDYSEGSKGIKLVTKKDHGDGTTVFVFKVPGGKHWSRIGERAYHSPEMLVFKAEPYKDTTWKITEWLISWETGRKKS